MIGALSLLGFLALASPSGPAGAESLPAFPQPTLVADILPGPAGSTPGRFHAVRTGVIFFAWDTDPPATSLGALWRTDGTRAGTFSIQPAGIEIVNDLDTPGPYQWLPARDANGVESVWRTDGTAAGTIKILDRHVADSSYWYQQKTGRFYFRALPFGSDPSAPRNLWVSDGTPEGTRQLTSLTSPPAGARLRKADMDPAPSDRAAFGRFAELGDGVFFVDFGGPQGAFSLWRTDGTPEGTHLVATPSDDFEFQAVWKAGSSLYLLAGQPGDGPARLWKSNGTTAGTVQIDTFGTGTSSFSLFGELDNGRSLWLVFKNFEVGASIWSTNGNPNGAVRLLTLATSAMTWPQSLNGLLYFVANDGRSGRELWRTDGTPAGTRLAFDRCPGACSGFYNQEGSELILVANRILALSDDPIVGIEPLVTDGTLAGTQRLGDLCPGRCGASTLEDQLRDFGGAFFFLENHTPTPATFPQLWATDLTPAGTVRVTDFPGGVYATAQIGDRLILTADDGVLGPELWSLTVPEIDPVPPPGPWLSSRTLPGFEVKVRIANVGGAITGALEPGCIPETVCVSGAVRGRSEVFVRVVGPRPNGRLWPTLVKFTTSEVEIWIRQISTGTVRYYRLEGARPGFDELPGLFDREGFTP